LSPMSPMSPPSTPTTEHPGTRLDALRALLLHESDLIGQWHAALRQQELATARNDADAASRSAFEVSRLQLQLDRAKRRRSEAVTALRGDVTVWG
jgi:hypothetical protein